MVVGILGGKGGVWGGDEGGANFSGIHYRTAVVGQVSGFLLSKHEFLSSNSSKKKKKKRKK
jgi:hypothetical protein